MGPVFEVGTMTDIFAANYRPEPFWWRAAPRPHTTPQVPPAKADVVVVGSGILGLNAAIPIARAGRAVTVIESGALGRAASTRLAGFMGRSLLHSLPTLIGRYGRDAAMRMFAEAGEAHFFLLDWIKREKMDVAMLYRGRFTAAHTPAAYEALARSAEEVSKLVTLNYSMCPKSEQHREIGTDFYHGGMIWEEHGTLHPGLYHDALVARARDAGVIIVDGLAVEQIVREGDGFKVSTRRGLVSTRDVVIATNGHSRDEKRAAPWLRKRIIPVIGHQIVTEPLPTELMKSIKPGGRAMHDTRQNLLWDRPTPDDSALLFGGRTGYGGSVETTARKLHALMLQVYPQLEGVRLQNSWQGMMGFTFDRIPHIGRTPDGAYYGAICNAQGLPIGTYLGQRLARELLGQEPEHSVFWNRELPTWPFYNGNPWFLPFVLASYAISDRAGVGANTK